MKTNLTWQDVRRIVNIADDLAEEYFKEGSGLQWNEEFYYKKVLEEFNNGND